MYGVSLICSLSKSKNFEKLRLPYRSSLSPISTSTISLNHIVNTFIESITIKDFINIKMQYRLHKMGIQPLFKSCLISASEKIMYKENGLETNLFQKAIMD